MNISYISRKAVIPVAVLLCSIIADPAVAMPQLCKAQQCGGIHTFAINTPQDQILEVFTTGSFGKLSGENCQLAKTADFGAMRIMTGDKLGLSSDAIKYFAGEGYTCASFTFTYKQAVKDNFKLIWDNKGKQYTGSVPSTSQINIQ